jgi:1-acyl-sn-glycerol-3-phosphate acyltransferase
MDQARVIPFDGEPGRDKDHGSSQPRGNAAAGRARSSARNGSSAQRSSSSARRRERHAESQADGRRGWPRDASGLPDDEGRAGDDNLDGEGARHDHRERGGVESALGGLLDRALGPGWERQASRLLAFARRRVSGDYEIDEFGFDHDLTENVLMALLRPWYERYFRVELRGIDNVPNTGGALLVANHSGTLPLDALMTQLALLDHHPAHRHLRMLAADLVFRMPFVGELARKSGHTLACAPDAERLLGAGNVVGVWPEGFKGIGKPFSQRYKLQRFGRGGFVSAALRTHVPIVPTAIVGAEEIYPMIGNSKTLARLLGLPYFPLTPTFPWLGPLGAVPLPSKWFIAFGEPIPTDGYDASAAEDPMTIFNLTDQVRETIQDTLYRVLLERRSVFF